MIQFFGILSCKLFYKKENLVFIELYIDSDSKWLKILQKTNDY